MKNRIAFFVLVFCFSTIHVSAQTVCLSPGQVYGTTQTANGEALTNVVITARSTDGSVVRTTASDSNGNYTIDDLETGLSYIFELEKYDDPYNGVDDRDLMLMSRYILDTTANYSFLQYYGGDLSGIEGQITAFDLVTVDQLLRGNITGQFAIYPGWHFIPATELAKRDPFEKVFPPALLNQPLSIHASTRINFIGVKTGDVDFSASAN